jgi:uncharacterized protein YndB with AHSA1/START domain
MIEPLRLRFDVDCSPTEAFTLWTTRTTLWWPASHTLSGTRGTAIIFEPGANGRIYERSQSGEEKDWGTVLHWEPPNRLVYTWYIFSDPEDATEVEVNFRANPDGATTVAIEHRGWDAFDDGAHRRDQNQIGWQGLVAPYTRACNSS